MSDCRPAWAATQKCTGSEHTRTVCLLLNDDKPIIQAVDDFKRHPMPGPNRLWLLLPAVY